MTSLYLIQISTLFIIIGGVLFLFMGLRVRRKVLEKMSPNKENSNTKLVGNIAWFGYKFIHIIFPDKFPYPAHYFEMVQKDQDRKELSAGSLQFKNGIYSKTENMEKKISRIKKHAFNCEI